MPKSWIAFFFKLICYLQQHVTGNGGIDKYIILEDAIKLRKII